MTLFSKWNRTIWSKSFSADVTVLDPSLFSYEWKSEVRNGRDMVGGRKNRIAFARNDFEFSQLDKVKFCTQS